MPRTIRISAEWDPEALVWVAESADVPGLVAESDTVEGLTAKLEQLLPDVLEANDARTGSSAFELVTKRPLQLVP